MAELLVCLVNNEAADFYAQCAAPQRGDVILLHEDGYAWSRGELNHEDWLILHLARAMNDLAALLAPEILQVGGSARTLQYRSFYLDLNDPALPVKQRPPIADLQIIGASLDVIG